MRNDRLIGIAAAALGGAGIAAQSEINSELSVRLSDGFGAALVSFGSGLAIITAVVLIHTPSRRGVTAVRAAIRRGDLRAYHCFGGACGALLVASQGLTVAALGVAIFTIAVVGGQMLAGLAVDRLGIGPAGAQAVTGSRIVAALIAIVAVAIAVGDRLSRPSAALLAVLPAAAGVGSAWQQAVNGRVRVAAGSAATATQVNFMVGTVVLVFAFTIDVLIRGWPEGRMPANPLYYLGGCLGVVFVAIAAVVVHRVGVLLLGLSTVAGQLAGALAIDMVAPGAEGRPGANIFVGVALTLVAVTVASLRLRRGAAVAG